MNLFPFSLRARAVEKLSSALRSGVQARTLSSYVARGGVLALSARGYCLLVELGKLANVFEDVESWFDLLKKRSSRVWSSRNRFSGGLRTA